MNDVITSSSKWHINQNQSKAHIISSLSFIYHNLITLLYIQLFDNIPSTNSSPKYGKYIPYQLQSINQSINQSIKQSNNQTINQTIKQSNTQTINQSNKQTMKSCSLSIFLSLFLLVAVLLPQTTMAFTTSPLSRNLGSRSSIVTTRSESSNTKLFFFGKKDDGSPGDYVCKDVRTVSFIVLLFFMFLSMWMNVLCVCDDSRTDDNDDEWH